MTIKMKPKIKIRKFKLTKNFLGKDKSKVTETCNNENQNRNKKLVKVDEKTERQFPKNYPKVADERIFIQNMEKHQHWINARVKMCRAEKEEKQRETGSRSKLLS